ncbi:hypothetical protein PVNG_05807 [Plasmodium vivax North Korean]|uniref:VIR protein n=1 Tax=Plasmodium vivax North Korean TaxID=1035514 RepID=A0A0J9TLY9_PLAVI|nr:hypothetical protein PVNG_05807 [Plasmodium vivax North Korean]
MILITYWKPYEQECNLSKFIKNLDDAKDLEPIGFVHEFQSIESTQKDNVLEFFSILQKNYSSINTCNVNIRNQCCSYLNYWLYQKKAAKRIGKLYINDEAWELVDKLWNRLKGNNPFSCKRKRHEINMVYKKTCIDFMVYCVNKDELKQKCQHNDDGLKEMYCKNFNEFTNNYYTYFTKNVTCLRDTNKDIHYNWRFSDSCTLHDVAKTFPKYDEEKQTIVDDTSKNPITKCNVREDSGTINCYMLDGVPVTLEELPTIDVIPLKYGIYAGTSFLGFFSLGLYLYKVNKLLY